MAADPILSKRKTPSIDNEKPTRPVNPYTGEAYTGRSTHPDATPFKKGGAVKSGTSRGDGCAQRGRTRGTMR